MIAEMNVLLKTMSYIRIIKSDDFFLNTILRYSYNIKIIYLTILFNYKIPKYKTYLRYSSQVYNFNVL